MTTDRRSPVVVRGFRAPFVHAGTVAAIQTVFQRSRLSHQSWRSRQDQGRLDSRTVWRNDARGALDIFKERHNPSPTKLNVWLLVDASGSMNGQRACDAQDFCATMAETFKRISTVTLHIWQHNATTEVGGHVSQLHRVYDRGVNRISTMLLKVGGGNADGFALMGLGQRALKEQRKDERTVIVVISDGAPTEHGTGTRNSDLVAFSRNVSEDLRSKGVAVLSVGIAGNGAENANMYGKEWTIPFNEADPKAWDDLAAGLGATFGRAVGA